MLALDCKLRSQTRIRPAFTLVELLIVLFILLLLSLIALPITKQLLNDQKTTKAAQSLESFIAVAKNRAIAEGRVVGVRIDRLSNEANSGNARSTSIIVRQLVGVPPYSGDAASAKARLNNGGSGTINQATFSAADSPLLALSATLLATAGSEAQSPIRIGDLLELPGGRLVPILSLTNSGSNTIATFNLREPVSGVDTFPSGGRGPIDASGDEVQFRIHRSPTPSRSKVLSLNRGRAIDLNYSGIGLNSVNFAPDTNGATVEGSIDILFSPDGTVSSVTNNGARLFPQSLIFLCIGTIDGVANIESTTTDDAFIDDAQFTANIRNLNSVWLVISPQSGRISTVPFASIESNVSALRDLTTPPNFNDPTDAAFANVIRQSRSFAALSDTVAQ